ncbi:MAG: type II toxin-antitoxin system VapC family toxin [Nitrospirota bacterium]
MQRNLKDFKGKEAIFIDANIFLHHAFDVNPISVDFLKKVESFDLKAYTSALVIEEVIFKLILQSASNFLDKITLQNVKVLLKDTENKEKVFRPVEKYRGYINNLKDFGLTILDLTDKDMAVAIQEAKTYGLITADAAHIAVMERKGITHMASSDSDFNVVNNITLWSP